jgi:hypothetical protein
MNAAKTAPRFYGIDTDWFCVMPSGRIWQFDGDDAKAAVRELAELPADVESYTGDVLPREFMQGHLSRIGAASGETL